MDLRSADCPTKRALDHYERSLAEQLTEFLEEPVGVGGVKSLSEHLRRSGSDAEWLRGFLAIIGRSLVIPDQLRSPLAQGGTGDPRDPPPPMGGRASVDRLTAAPFPKLVISGKHSPAFEAVCVALRLQAQRKARIKVRIRSCVSNRARFVARPEDTEGAAQYRQNVGRAPRIWSHR